MYNLDCLPKTHLTVLKLFSPEDVQRILDLSDRLTKTDAMVAGEGYRRIDPTARISKTAFFQAHNPDHQWIFAAMGRHFVTMNAKHFGFSLQSVENVQYVEYYAENAGHFALHMDLIPGSFMRKLAATVQLTPDDAYEGGDLVLQLSESHSVSAVRSPGDGIMYPTYIMHKVTPVTRGVRKALLAWASGPAFQ